VIHLLTDKELPKARQSIYNQANKSNCTSI